MKVGEWTIKGVSVAGRHTTIMIDELKICLDAGVVVDGIERMQTILISHGHIDHIGSLNTILALRRMRKMERPLCIMPEVCIAPFKILTSAISALERGKCDTILYNNLIKCDIKIADGLEKMQLKNNQNYVITSFETKHKIKSFGYCIYNKRSKLKEEYKGLGGNELKKKKSDGEVITYDIYVNEIGFTGDLLFESVISNEEFLRAKVLIMECTFLDDCSIEEAHGGYHIHISEIVKNQNAFKNEMIVLTHFSDRYKSEEIMDRLKNSGMEEWFKEKVYVLIETDIKKL